MSSVPSRAVWRCGRIVLGVGCAVLMLACRPGKDADAPDGAPTPLRGDVDLSIGEAEGAEDYTFAYITGIAVDSAGRMFVADNEANTVRVFGPDGKLRYTIGRQGQGPGELMRPCCPALRGDTLWVRDGGNSRYDLFVVGDTSAVPLSTVRMAHRDVNRSAPVTFDSAGNVIDIGSGPISGSAPGATPVLMRFHVDRTGAIVSSDSVPAPPEDSTPVFKATGKVPGGMMTRFIYPPYPALALRAHSPTGEHARAVSSRYSIAWLAADGRLLRTIVGKAEPPSLTAAEVARAESALVRDQKWATGSAEKSPFTVPSHKQPLRDLYFDRDGRLWVELSVAEGAPRRADVYSRTGSLIHTVEWPSNVAIGSYGAVTGMTAYGVSRDSLDIERVARIRLRPID